MLLAELLNEATDLDHGELLVVVVDEVEHVELEAFELDDLDGQIFKRKFLVISLVSDLTEIGERAVTTEARFEIVAFVFSFGDDERVEQAMDRDVFGKGEDVGLVVKDAGVFFFIDDDILELHANLFVILEHRGHDGRTDHLLRVAE